MGISYNIADGGSSGMYGRKLSEKTRKNMSYAHKGLFINGPLSRTILQYALDGSFIKK